MASKKNNPMMRAEMWFGGRKNKRCMEVQYTQDQQEQFIADLNEFLESRGFHARKLYPERPADFVDKRGRQFWIKEGLMSLPGGREAEVREFFIRSDEKKLNGKKPHIRTKRINGRCRTIQSEVLESDEQYNNDVISELMNQMLLTDILASDNE